MASFFIWESWIKILFVPLKPHLWTIQLCKPVCTDLLSYGYRSALCTWLEVQLARNLNSGASHLAQSFSWIRAGDRCSLGLGFPHITHAHVTLTLPPAAWGAILVCFWLKRLSMTKAKKTAIEGEQSSIYPMVLWLKSFFLEVGDVSPSYHRQRIRCTWIS